MKVYWSAEVVSAVLLLPRLTHNVCQGGSLPVMPTNQDYYTRHPGIIVSLNWYIRGAYGIVNIFQVVQRILFSHTSHFTPLPPPKAIHIRILLQTQMSWGSTSHWIQTLGLCQTTVLEIDTYCYLSLRSALLKWGQGAVGWTESLLYLTMPLEHIDFHIIGYWTSSVWSL